LLFANQKSPPFCARLKTADKKKQPKLPFSFLKTLR